MKSLIESGVFTASLLILAGPAFGLDGTFDNLTAGVDSNAYGKVEVKLGGLIFGKGTFNLSPTLPTGSPYQGAGTRMLWYPRLAAFRAGSVDDTQWNAGSLGAYSAAFGHDPVASGEASFAVGWGSTSTGAQATALGFDSVASGDRSLAAGDGSTASGQTSLAFGYGVYSSGEGAVALGWYTSATGDAAFTMGSGSTASGSMSVALGDASIADGYASFASGSSQSFGEGSSALGYSYADAMFSSALGAGIATGEVSTAMGGAKAESSYSTAIGVNNIGGGSPDTWILTDPLFEIGNAGTTLTPSNALTVYKNGNMDVQGAITCAPGGDIPMFGE